MVRLRFQRYGRHNNPFYRLAAIDGRTRRDGPVLENLGWYNPIAKDVTKQLEIDEERVKYWISKGAQPSDTVRDILAKRNIGDLKTWEAVRARQRKIVEEKKAAAAAAEAAGEKKDEKKA